MVSSIQRFHCIQDSQLDPDGVLYTEVPLYAGQSARSQWCPLYRGSTVYRTASWIPVVSSIQRFHCIQDSQLDPSGVLYTEVPLYIKCLYYAFIRSVYACLPCSPLSEPYHWCQVGAVALLRSAVLLVQSAGPPPACRRELAGQPGPTQAATPQVCGSQGAGRKGGPAPHPDGL